MINRRRLIATLGGVAGGILHPSGPLFAEPPTPTPTNTATPTPKPCPPGTISLQEFYGTPPDANAAVDVLAQVFEKGVKLKDASLSKGPVLEHLKKSYAETLSLKFSNFQGGNPNPNWALLVDHTFILGQLTVSLRKAPLPPALKPYDVLRAQAKFSEATSSTTCGCFIPNKYELPAARPGEASLKRKNLCDDPSGEIDSGCPLC